MHELFAVLLLRFFPFLYGGFFRVEICSATERRNRLLLLLLADHLWNLQLLITFQFTCIYVFVRGVHFLNPRDSRELRESRITTIFFFKNVFFID